MTVWTLTAAPPELARYVLSLLESLGYRASLNARYGADDPAEYFYKVSFARTRAQIGFGGWGLDYPSPEGFIRPLLSCAAVQAGTNLAGFCDRSVDAQMDRAASTQVHDPAEGIRLWQRVEDSSLAQAPIIPAFNSTFVTLLSARTGNYQFNPQWGISSASFGSASPRSLALRAPRSTISALERALIIGLWPGTSARPGANFLARAPSPTGTFLTNERAPFSGPLLVGGTGLEPGTPSLSSMLAD